MELEAESKASIEQELKSRIAVHKKFYDSEEKQKFKKVQRYYQGKFTKEEANENDPKVVFEATKNLIFPLIDTAISAIIGNNPAVAATTIEGQTSDASLIATSNMGLIWKKNDMLRVVKVAFTDGGLYGRGTFKVGWSVKDDMPQVSTVDVDAFFFDLSTKYQNRMRYKFECTPIPVKRFNKRRQMGMYPLLPAYMEVQGSARPGWMGVNNSVAARKPVDDVDSWVVVWEYYDLDEMKVYHYLENENIIILADDLKEDPYVTWEMNFNGEDCRGISEAILILSQQETVNDLLTFWKNVVYLIIPRIFYNAGLISEDDLNAAVSSAVGAYVPVHTNGEGLPPSQWKDAFMPQPVPDMPVEAVNLLDRQEADAGYVSAISDLARNQLAGAKTATEVAVMDQFSRSRTSTREGNFTTALEAVAEKMWNLDQRKLAGSRRVEVVRNGKKTRVNIGLADIQKIQDVQWEWSAYNPIKNNPLVLADLLKQFLPFIQDSPLHDQQKFWSYLHRTIGLPMDILKTEEQLAKDKAEAEAAKPAPPTQPAPAMPTEPAPAMEALPVEPMPEDQAAQIPPAVQAAIAQGQGAV
jgi:hypothetical protein